MWSVVSSIFVLTLDANPVNPRPLYRLTTARCSKTHRTGRSGRDDDYPEPSMSLDQDRRREGIQDPADEAEEPADRLARLRAAVTRLDSEPSLLSAARGIRRRLPGDEKFGDPLSTAGRAPVEVIARSVSALQPGRESVAKELGLSALQVWQSVSEATGRGRGDLEMALLFTDLVGFSGWALHAGDAAVLELLREVGTRGRGGDHPARGPDRQAIGRWPDGHVPGRRGGGRGGPRRAGGGARDRGRRLLAAHASGRSLGPAPQARRRLSRR